MSTNKNSFAEDMVSQAKTRKRSTILTSSDKETHSLKLETVAVATAKHFNTSKPGAPSSPQVTEHNAGIAVCQLVQIGGALNSAAPTTFVFVHVDETPEEKRPKLTVAIFRHIFKTLGLPGKTFQFAVQNGTVIAQIAEQSDLKGLSTNRLRNLTPQEGQEDIPFPKGQEHWMSDFQRSNADCPQAVRILLQRKANEQKARMAKAQSTQARMKGRTAPKRRKKGK